MRQEIADQLEAFLRTVRRRRQAEIDQRELGRVLELAQELDGVLARIAGVDLEVVAQREGERIGDQRIVVNHEQPGLGLRHRLGTAHGCTS